MAEDNNILSEEDIDELLEAEISDTVTLLTIDDKTGEVLDRDEISWELVEKIDRLAIAYGLPREEMITKLMLLAVEHFESKEEDDG